jgi:hypothetical protein
MTSKPDEIKSGFFGSTETEMKQFFAGIGEVTFDKESLTFKNYPFDNSFVATNSKITSKEDVLQAMKPELNTEDFNSFYNLVMEIASPFFHGYISRTCVMPGLVILAPGKAV